jgi:hypothetical protein
MTMDSARRAVFDTNELLENILSFLPLKKLFVLQNVSRQWRGVIVASPGLQEKMFLRPLSATTKETWILDGCDKVGLKKGLHEYLQHVGRPGRLKLRRFDGSRTPDGGLLIPIIPDPILEFTDWRTATGRAFMGVDMLPIRVHPTVLRNHSSLLKMYISDPPMSSGSNHGYDQVRRALAVPGSLDNQQ